MFYARAGVAAEFKYLRRQVMYKKTYMHVVNHAINHVMGCGGEEKKGFAGRHVLLAYPADPCGPRPYTVHDNARSRPGHRKPLGMDMPAGLGPAGRSSRTGKHLDLPTWTEAYGT